MPRDPGKQKRANKHKKRRDERRKARAQRSEKPLPVASGAHEDLTAVCGYDADAAPVSEWRALGEQERMDRVTRYHEVVLPPGKRPPSLPRHVGMHVLVENQLAEDAPPQARQALARLMRDGLSRHDAVHAIGWLLTETLKRAVAKQQPVDERAYALELEQLSRASWLARASP